jgi:hypothetical protein
MPDENLSRVDFAWNDEGEVVACPTGHAPTRQGERASSDRASRARSLHVFFDAATCNACPELERCPVRQPNNARSRDYRLDVGPQLLARDQQWVEQKTESWKADYRIRSGIEATNSELKRGHGMGQLRVRRKPRVLLNVALKLTACNIKRWGRAARRRATALAALTAGIFAIWAVLRPKALGDDRLVSAPT